MTKRRSVTRSTWQRTWPPTCLGETVGAKAGEADVDLAIRDALATFAADEIVVAVRPTDQEGKVESVATSSAPTGSLHGIPVRYVVIRE